MGDVGPTETRSAVAHLVRRIAFGAPADVIDELAGLGYAGAIDRLCDLARPDEAAEAIEPPAFDTEGYLDAGDDPDARREAARQAATERRQLIGWWLRRMVAAEQPTREWLTFAWHDHFATSVQKVKIAELMYGQYLTLYQGAAGRFDQLVGAVARDPAMLIWLDGRRSTDAAPNENFARELFELFTLGHGSGHGSQPYTEPDVTEAARALTGWTINRRTGEGTFIPRRHDDGSKTVLGVTGNLDLDDIVAAATDHPACAPHVAARLWSKLARPSGPDDPVIGELAGNFADDFDVAALLRRMVLHPEFLTTPTRTGLLKTPVQFIVGTARALRVELDAFVIQRLVRLGQVPFLPPDVNGWPANEAWISTSSAQTRLEIALRFAAAAADAVDSIASAAESDRPGAAARILGVDTWGSSTTAALSATACDPSTTLALAVVAPEHLLA